MSVNKVICLGRVSKQPEQFGSAVKFSVALNETWTDKNGTKQEKTEFVSIVTFGKLSEICLQYLSTGREVYIEGKLETSSYEKDGDKRYSTSVIASTVQFIGGNTSNNGEDF